MANEQRELGPEFAPPTREAVIVHLPQLWTSDFTLRINWMVRNFDQRGNELPIVTPRPFELVDPEEVDRFIFASIGGMEGARSAMFVPERHLTLRDGRLLASLLTLRPSFGHKFELERLDIRPLLRTMKTGMNPADTAGGKRVAELRDAVERLETFWMRIDKPWVQGTNQVIAEKLISFKKATQYAAGKKHITDNITAEWIENFSMNQNFLRVVDETGRAIRLDVLHRFQSELLQSWYLVIPGWASHPRLTASNPWRRTLRELFHQAGVTTRGWGWKQWRKDQCEKLIKDQLDGSETMNGKLRVRLQENSDGDDFHLCAWIERGARRPVAYDPEGKLYTTWLTAGRSQGQFEERLRRGLQSLGTSEKEILDLAQYDYRQKGNQAFLCQAKALMGESRFMLALHQSKVSIQQYLLGGGCNPGRIVGTALMDAYREMLASGA